MSTIANKISSDSRNFLSGVKSSTTQNDRTLSSAMNLSMRLDGKEIELSQKRRMLNAESFIAPQQIQITFKRDTLVDIKLELNKELNKEYNWDKRVLQVHLKNFLRDYPLQQLLLLSQFHN